MSVLDQFVGGISEDVAAVTPPAPSIMRKFSNVNNDTGMICFLVQISSIVCGYEYVPF